MTDYQRLGIGLASALLGMLVMLMYVHYDRPASLPARSTPAVSSYPPVAQDTSRGVQQAVQAVYGPAPAVQTPGYWTTLQQLYPEQLGTTAYPRY